VARAKAYLRAKFHLDPSNRLATVHERHRQTYRTDIQDRTDRRRTDSIGRTVLQTVAQKLDVIWYFSKVLIFTVAHGLLDEESDIKVDELVYVSCPATVTAVCLCSCGRDGHSEPAPEPGSFQLNEHVPLSRRLAALLSRGGHVSQQAELLDVVERTCSQRVGDARPRSVRVDVELEVTDRRLHKPNICRLYIG